MAIHPRWAVIAALALALLALTGGALLVVGSSAQPGDEEPSSTPGGPATRLPPPRSLDELVASGDVIVTARVSKQLDRRTVTHQAGDFEVQGVELTVIEYVRGSGPSVLLVHQAVSPAGDEGVAHALTVPAVGTTGFFFLVPGRTLGEGGWQAPFGPDGRIVEGPLGAAILDRPDVPQPAFLAGQTMADIDRVIRELAAPTLTN